MNLILNKQLLVTTLFLQRIPIFFLNIVDISLIILSLYQNYYNLTLIKS